MSQQTNPTQDEEDDYDVIIEGAGIGDPIVVFGLKFSGKKAPTPEAPLSKVEVGISLFWEQFNKRLDVGRVKINKVSSQETYMYTVPYDDKYFSEEVDHQVPTSIYLSVSARNTLEQEVKFGNAQPVGNGQYVISSQDITPEYFDVINKILKSKDKDPEA